MDVSDGIWVDTDPTLGSAWSDVDDVLAVELVHRRGRLAGLSSVFGNRGIDTTHRVASELGRRFGVPVARGAAGPSPVRTAAVDALVAHRGPALALGPCTNIAAALAEGAHWSRWVGLIRKARSASRRTRLRTATSLTASSTSSGWMVRSDAARGGSQSTHTPGGAATRTTPAMRASRPAMARSAPSAAARMAWRWGRSRWAASVGTSPLRCRSKRGTPRRSSRRATRRDTVACPTPRRGPGAGDRGLAQELAVFDLRAHTHLLTIAGSRAYGLHTEHSDVDVKGFAVPPAAWLHGFRRRFEQVDDVAGISVFTGDLSEHEKQVVAGSKLEGSVYGLAKFVRLASDANPHMLDALFCRDDEVRLCTPVGQALRDARGQFLSSAAATASGAMRPPSSSASAPTDAGCSPPRPRPPVEETSTFLSTA